ncbi:S41 family peptidase [Roseivirga sp. UBA838]|uniref:S41 family peptidase n=1 Tax=Roseivirga sp. UBA838 TaxID=1947393 RepID=UPI00257C6A1C|nr:S41 family peptidase [Roseivirga sp. UBA838]
MHRLYLFIFSVFAPVVGQAQDLSQKQAAEDLLYLKKELEAYHPGMYRYTGKDSIDWYFQTALDQIQETDQIGFFASVSFLVNKLRCGHTQVLLPEMDQRTFLENQLFIPLEIRAVNGKWFVFNASLTGDQLKSGDELVSVNGLKMDEIVRRIFEHQSADGYITTGRLRLTEQFFPYFYQLFVSRGTTSFQVEVSSNTGLKTIVLPGVSYTKIRAMRRPFQQPPQLVLRHEASYSYMKINTFSSRALSDAGLNYERFLAESFRELKQKEAQTLVIDLRGNGGGDDNYGAALVAYLARNPFRYFERIEVTESYSGYGNIVREKGRRLMTSHKGLDEWKPEAQRFRGKVYVLIDGWSFSTCADVAAVLHHNEWATLVGEESGGGYDGNTSGSTRTLILPHSGLRVNLPMWMYTTANSGHPYHGRGVIPHNSVSYTLQQLMREEDAVMEKVKSLIK